MKSFLLHAMDDSVSRVPHVGRCSLAVCAVLAICFCGSSVNSVHAQNEKKQLKKPQTVSFRTRDKLELAGTYYESNTGKEAPVVVLLHGEGGNRLDWKYGLGGSLQRAGYAVITVDLRKHGQSKKGSGNKTTRKKPRGRKGKDSVNLKPVDYKNMVAYDLEAVKKFIYEENQAGKLNMNKTGLVGAEMGAAVAVSFAWNDWLKKPHPDGVGAARTPKGQDVRALVLLTPEKINGIPYAKPLTTLRDPNLEIAFLFGVGRGDKQVKANAQRLFDLINKFTPNRDRTYFRTFPGGLRGAEILSRKELKAEAQIIEFLGRHLKSLPSTWRDRKSKLAN